MVIPDCGEAELLARALNKNAPDNCKLKLFTDDQAITEGMVVGDLTECAAAGYAAKTLTGASFTVATAGGVTTASYAEQTYTFSASATIYGWYLTNNDGSILLAVEKWDAPITIVDSGTIAITPEYTLA